MTLSLQGRVGRCYLRAGWLICSLGEKSRVSDIVLEVGRSLFKSLKDHLDKDTKKEVMSIRSKMENY